jgi:hypothetical protein
MLAGFLDWYRSVVERKLDGLGLADAARSQTASGLSPLGVVKHLGWVERFWFQDAFAGEPVDRMRDPEGSNSIQFVVEPEDTVASVLDFYRSQIEHSRRVLEACTTLDAISVLEHQYFGRVSMRWILIHMTEETARHAGHLDVMREAIDGRTGD